jgi:hypothetical protein
MRAAPFSPDFAYVAARPLTIDGADFHPGDPIPDGALSDRRLRQLYEQRKISPHAPAFLDNGASVAKALTEQAMREAGEGEECPSDAQEGGEGAEDAPTEQIAPKARQSRKKA